MDDDFQWNEGKGGLFKNKKGDNPKRPDYTTLRPLRRAPAAR